MTFRDSTLFTLHDEIWILDLIKIVVDRSGPQCLRFAE
jgi:hypothetical protein